MGCGQPAGESGFNIARVTAILAGLDDVPGVTVNRYCSSSLQTIRMAAHAIRAGEGDVFIAAGVETVSRFGVGMPPTAARPSTRSSPTPSRAPQSRSETVTEPWTPPARPARHLHRHGPDRRERRRVEKVSRLEMDEFALAARSSPSRTRRTASSSARSSPSRCPTARSSTQGRRPARGHHAGEALDAAAGVPRRRHRHRGQRLPPQRRRRRGDRDERHAREGARHRRRSRASSRAASAGSTPRSWASDRSRPVARRWRAPA